MSSYRVMVLCYGEKEFSGNGVRYATVEEAKAAALSLYHRWTAVKDWDVVESEDAPTQ